MPRRNLNALTSVVSSGEHDEEIEEGESYDLETETEPVSDGSNAFVAQAQGRGKPLVRWKRHAKQRRPQPSPPTTPPPPPLFSSPGEFDAPHTPLLFKNMTTSQHQKKTIVELSNE